MGPASLAPLLELTRAATLFSAQQGTLDFNSGYRGGRIQPPSGFGGDSLMILLFGLALVPVLLGLYWLATHRALVRMRVRHLLSGDRGEDSARSLDVLAGKRCELEVFACHKGVNRFVGLARLEKVTAADIRLVIMSPNNTGANLRGCLATAYFPPMAAENGTRLNCLRAVIEAIDYKGVVLGRRCCFGYESRRRHFRADVKDPRFVKARLWLTLPPSDGALQRLEDTPPRLDVDWMKRSGPAQPRVKDISVTGMAMLMPLARRDGTLEAEEPVTMNLLVLNRQTKKFRSLWVAGVIRNRINVSGGKVILGIQFTHRGASNGAPDTLQWARVDPDHGVPGLAGVLEGLTAN